MTKSITKASISGILAIDKPSGISSYDVIRQLKKKLGTKKMGHCGTLDPLASGLLIICIGEATKFASYIESETKEYVAGIQLGVSTTTYDAEGEILSKNPVNFTPHTLAQVLEKFQGEILQTPPAYSALKINGTPAYKLARKGLDVPLKSRNVVIHHLTLLEQKADRLLLRVTCSKGTYIRSLAHDIGKELGCGAYLDYLQRTRIGSFTLENAPSPEEATDILQNSVLDAHHALSGIPAFSIKEEYKDAIRTGKVLYPEYFHPSPELLAKPGIYKIQSEDKIILAIVEIQDDKKIKYKRVLIT